MMKISHLKLSSLLILIIFQVTTHFPLNAQTVINVTTVTTNAVYYVGDSTPSNTLTISNAGKLFVTNQSFLRSSAIGFGASSSNNVVQVTGANSLWTNRDQLHVGYNGAGNQMIVSNGGTVVNDWGYVGADASSSNNVVQVTGANSLWTNRGQLNVGNGGAGNQMIISNGGMVVNNSGYVGLASSNNVVQVTGTGSLWTNRNELRVGNFGASNQMIVSNGGMVVNNFGYVGNETSSSNNVVKVTGANSLWTNRGDLYVGISGARNRLMISNGGRVDNAVGYIGISTSSSNNVVLVTGADSQWTNRSTLFVGWFGERNSLSISDGGTVFATNMIIGDNASSTSNVVNLSGAASQLVVTNDAGTGSYDIRRGTNIQNEGTVRTDRLLLTNAAGLYSFNSGTAIVQNASISNGANFIIGGMDGTGGGAVHVAHTGTHNLQTNILVGSNTVDNTLTITNGGRVDNSIGYIGFATSSSNNVVLVTGTGSLWTNRSSLFVGNSGTANTLTITNGGAVYTTNMIVGANASSTNNLVKMWGADSQLVVTNAAGTGIYDIRRGTNVQNGGIIRTDRLLVTNAAAGGTGGVYILHGGTSYVGKATISNGAAFVVGNGTDTAYFRQTQAGVTNTFANGITINTGGAFSFAGVVTNLVTFNGGGMLSGTGTLTRALTIGAGAVLSPGNSPGTIIGAGMTWTNGGTYLWEINDFTGTQGADPGWDWISLSGALDITATVGNEFNIDLTSLTTFNTAGNAANFDDLQDYSFTILTAVGGITGFNTNAFNLNTGAFSNAFTGTWTISQSGNRLVLNYTASAIPEPSTWAMLILGAICTIIMFYRRTQEKTLRAKLAEKS